MLGMIHATLGDSDEALKWLSAAHEAHVDWFPWIASDAGYDSFNALALESPRDDPRFRELVAPLGLPAGDGARAGG